MCIKEAGAYEHNYNNGLFLTLLIYFSYGAEASNLRYMIVLLVTYCVQNMKKNKLLLMFGALRVKKKTSFMMSHFHVIHCIMLPIARDPYFTYVFNPTHWLVVLQLQRPSSVKSIHPHNQFIRPTKWEEMNWSKSMHMPQRNCDYTVSCW